MKQTFFSTKNIALSAAIAGVYAALTLLLHPLSYGAFQFRLSEALTLLPVLLPQAIPWLTLGCFIANLLGSPTPWDVLFGTLATALAAITTYRLRRQKLWIAALPPVIFNAFIISLVLYFTANAGEFALGFTMLFIGFGQAAVCYLLGIPLVLALSKLPLDQYLS